MTPPVHLVVPGTERHGVTLLATQLAGAMGAPVVDDWAAVAGGQPVHLHLTDRLLGDTPEAAAAAFADLARRHPTTVTLHDVPQPTDGEWFGRRRDCYADVLDAAAGWATNSHAERRTVAHHCAPALPGVVVHLPIVGAAPVEGPVEDTAVARERSVAVFGWVYPGKGYDEALAAAALLGDSPASRPAVVALGAVADGHDALVDDLTVRAERLGVRFEVTGWLGDDEARDRLRTAGVGLVAHANVSASGSLNSWVAAGRIPLVRVSDYAEEIARLRPGTLDVIPSDVSPEQLAAWIAARLDGPPDHAVGPPPGPHLADAAEAYGAWWAT